MPILTPLARVPGLGPEVVMLPAALAASCGFMLPVATPPNAVVYGTGRIPIGSRNGTRCSAAPRDTRIRPAWRDSSTDTVMWLDA